MADFNGTELMPSAAFKALMPARALPQNWTTIAEQCIYPTPLDVPGPDYCARTGRSNLPLECHANTTSTVRSERWGGLPLRA